MSCLPANLDSRNLTQRRLGFNGDDAGPKRKIDCGSASNVGAYVKYQITFLDELSMEFPGFKVPLAILPTERRYPLPNSKAMIGCDSYVIEGASYYISDGLRH